MKMSRTAQNGCAASTPAWAAWRPAVLLAGSAGLRHERPSQPPQMNVVNVTVAAGDAPPNTIITDWATSLDDRRQAAGSAPLFLLVSAGGVWHPLYAVVLYRR